MATAFDALFAASGTKWNVPPSLLEALARTESSLNAHVPDRYEAKLDEYSVGLMQMLESTARNLGFQGTRDQLRAPATNVDLAAKLAREIIDRQKGLNLADFYSEYNSGRASLWRSSTQVATHVSRFLSNFAKAAGLELPPGVSIPNALNILGNVKPENFAALLIALGLILFFAKR
jgi:soluble lytic murein transglycosylase-like protein